MNREEVTHLFTASANKYLFNDIESNFDGYEAFMSGIDIIIKRDITTKQKALLNIKHENQFIRAYCKGMLQGILKSKNN